MEHPLQPRFILRVGTDGSKTPREALLQAIADILVDLQTVAQQFNNEMDLYRIANGWPPAENMPGVGEKND